MTDKSEFNHASGESADRKPEAISKGKNARKSTKRQIMATCIALLVLSVLALGSTYAWFTSGGFITMASPAPFEQIRVEWDWFEPNEARFATFRFNPIELRDIQGEFEDIFEETDPLVDIEDIFGNPRAQAQINAAAGHAIREMYLRHQAHLEDPNDGVLIPDEITIHRATEFVTPGSLIFANATFINDSNVDALIRVRIPHQQQLNNFFTGNFVVTIPNEGFDDGLEYLFTEDHKYGFYYFEGAFYYLGILEPPHLDQDGNLVDHQLRVAIGAYIGGALNDAETLNGVETVPQNNPTNPDNPMPRMGETLNLSGVIVEMIQPSEQAVLDIWGQDVLDLLLDDHADHNTGIIVPLDRW